MYELKPCPFCGGKAKIKIVSTDGIAMMPKITWHRVECKKCAANVESRDVSVAIEAWNRRTVEEVRHGEWIEDGCMYRCSECGNMESYYSDSYCRCCGAKMDGGAGA